MGSQVQDKMSQFWIVALGLLPLVWANPSVVHIGPRNASDIISKLEFPELTRQSPTRPFTIQVEGIVGVGKSTMLKAFEGYPDIDVLPEPVGEWTDLNGTDVLNLAFTDPYRWAATQESLSFNSFMREHLRRFGLVKAMERSVHSAFFCFAETLRKEGKMSPPEYAILSYWYKFLTDREPKYPTGFDTTSDLIVYLRVSPEVAFDRINGRGRSEEATIQMSYLRHLHQAHENWLVKGSSGFPVPAPRVLVIDTDHSLEEMMKIYKLLAEKIWADMPTKHKLACQ